MIFKVVFIIIKIIYELISNFNIVHKSFIKINDCCYLRCQAEILSGIVMPNMNAFI